MRHGNITVEKDGNWSLILHGEAGENPFVELKKLIEIQKNKAEEMSKCAAVLESFTV